MILTDNENRVPLTFVDLPNTGRHGHNGIEETVGVEVLEHAGDFDSVDRKRYLRNGKFERTANHITFLKRLAIPLHLLWPATCRQRPLL